MSVSAHTATALLCRKLLMYVAVEKGAEEGKSFQYYVTYLADNHYVPPDGRAWVDHIRVRGNDATHQITIIAREDAEQLVIFTAMLLRQIYEFAGRLKPPQP